MIRHTIKKFLGETREECYRCFKIFGKKFKCFSNKYAFRELQSEIGQLQEENNTINKDLAQLTNMLKEIGQKLAENNFFLKKNEQLLEQIASLSEQITLLNEQIVAEFEKDRTNLSCQTIRLASLESADYIQNNMPKAKKFSEIEELWKYALDLAITDGLFLEFGVYSGTSINFMSSYKAECLFYGFDSFEGLPEDWRSGFEKETFKCDIPEVNSNVELIVGYFDHTLEAFLNEKSGSISFIHIDCDLYSSTRTVFNYLKDRIISGTIILFDEYFNYPNWKNGEYKAFQEFVKENNVTYEYLAYRDVHEQVLVRIFK